MQRPPSLPAPPLVAALVLALTAFVVAALVTLAPDARAQGTTRTVAVIDISADDKDNAQIYRDVLRGLRKVDGYEIKDTHVVLNAGAEVEGQNNIKTAEAFYKAGVNALDEGEAEDALEQLESAASMMERDYAVLRDRGSHRKLLLQLGVAATRAGERDTALAAFVRAVTFRADPATVGMLDEEAALFKEAESAVASLSLGAVLIETVPSHAEIYVDGRFRGISPATVAGLTEGRHLVAAYKAGYARHTEAITASSSGLESTEILLEPARRKPQYDQLKDKLAAEVGSKVAEGVRSVGALLFTETALVVRSTGEGAGKKIGLFLYDVASKTLLNSIDEPVDWSSRNKGAVAAMVARLVDIDYATALGGVTTGPGDGAGAEEESSIVEQWWFWTIIGAVVVGGTTAGVVVALQDDGPPPPKGGALVVQF